MSLTCKRAGLTAKLLGVFLTLACADIVQAWDEEGHIIITKLAIASLPPDTPEWMKTPEAIDRLCYLAPEPDRWRGQRSLQVDHANNPDHYIDGEMLPQYGLSLLTLPTFRREFTDILATQRALHPEKFQKHDPNRDKAYVYTVPGLLPYSIAELQWKVAASLTTLKTYEANRELVTDEMIRNARENVLFHMGILSHFVGDGSQPLHVTEHHHGWAGPNPNGYTTDKAFHAYIDGGVIRYHNITTESLLPRKLAPAEIDAEKYFPEICEYLNSTMEQVEPLYKLEKSGDLNREVGKKFIEAQLLRGGSMLAGVWICAQKSAVIDDFRENQLKHQHAKKMKANKKEKKETTPKKKAA